MLKRIPEEKEVVDRMMMLYDKAQVLEAYIESERREGAEEAQKNMVAALYGKKMPLEVIAEVTRQSVPTIRKWLNLPPEVAE